MCVQHCNVASDKAVCVCVLEVAAWKMKLYNPGGDKGLNKEDRQGTGEGEKYKGNQVFCRRQPWNNTGEPGQVKDGGER